MPQSRICIINYELIEVEQEDIHQMKHLNPGALACHKIMNHRNRSYTPDSAIEVSHKHRFAALSTA